MVLATMQSIMDNKGIDYDKLMYEFYLWLAQGKYTQEGQPIGYGGTTFNAVRRYSLGCDALKCGINIDKCNGNGALMRMLPIVFYLHKIDASEEEVEEITRNVTKLTHAHEYNILGTYIFVKYCLNILNGYTKEESYKMIRENDYTKYSKRAIKRYEKILKNDISKYKECEIKSGGSIWETLEAVLWCLLTSNSYREVITKAINLGGDTDTIGAIAGGVAGILYKDIPKEWVNNIIGFNKIKRTIKQFSKIMK